MAIKIGQVIDDKYEIVRLIGEGGMGAVYEGRNRFISRTVAIKVLLPTAIEADPSAVKRFEREAQAAGRIGSDHILEVIDLGALASGERYLVMEYLEGETLAERMRRLGRLAPRELHPILVQALQGLSAAHRAGIVHRDLKPDNLFILKEKAGTPDFVKLIDFGISKFNDPSPEEMSMTRTGALMGTPYYMSPEQAKGADTVSHQTDLYSLGVIAFEAITGHVPYDGDTFNDLMFKIVLSDMPNPEALVGGLDPAFCAIVKRAMERDLRRRFSSAEDFLAALDRWSPMAATVADGTPMSVQGGGMTGDFGLQTLSPLSEATGLMTSKLTGDPQRIEELGPRDREPRDRSRASLAATSLVDQRSIPSTKVIPSSGPRGEGPASDPTIPSTNVPGVGHPPTGKASSEAGTRAKQDPKAAGDPSDQEPAAAGRRAAGEGATLQSPREDDTSTGGQPEQDSRQGRNAKAEADKGKAEEGKGKDGKGKPRTSKRDGHDHGPRRKDTLDGRTLGEGEGPATEPLPLNRGPRPGRFISVVLGTAAVGLALLLLLPTEEDRGDAEQPETAGLQESPGADPRIVAPIEVDPPEEAPLTAPVERRVEAPSGENSEATPLLTGPPPTPTPPAPKPVPPAPRPVPRPAPRPEPTPTPKPTGSTHAPRTASPAPPPTPAGSASFDPVPPTPPPEKAPIPRDFGY